MSPGRSSFRPRSLSVAGLLVCAGLIWAAARPGGLLGWGVVTVAFVGDTALHLTGPKEPPNPVDLRASFEHLRRETGGADFLVGNLEGPIVGPGRAPARNPNLPHQPEGAAAALAQEGFHALSLANNHAMDYGLEGLLETRERLERAGIRAFGAGRDAAEAREPLILERNGVRIGVLAYREKTDKGRVYAGKERGGVAALTEGAVARDVRALKRRVDFVVVYPHWGGTNRPKVTPEQRALATAMAEAGADLVIGHHPHVSQAVEAIGSTPVLYSIGNHVFHGVRVGDRFDLTEWQHGLVATVEFTRGRPPRIALASYFNNNPLTGYVPRPSEADAAERLFGRILARWPGEWTRDGHRVVLEAG
ncbi:CapA family protein [Myxococcota bacterium]|nr:CapA family protein [Myxococcota bacterium]